MDQKTNPLIIIRRMLHKMRPADEGTYYLYVNHGDIQLCRYPDVPRNFPVIARLNSNNINFGMSPGHWNSIAAKIRIFIKQGIIEWEPPKH